MTVPLHTARPRLPLWPRFCPLAAAVLLAGALAGCSTSSPDVVKREDAQRMSLIQDAIVLSVRPVVVEGTQTGLGGMAGAVTGGVAGNSVGGRREQAVVGMLGAVAGAVVGNLVERSSTREDALEILLRMPNGDRRAVVQAKGKDNFEVGDAVIVITTGGKTRVARVPAMPPAPASGSSR